MSGRAADATDSPEDKATEVHHGVYVAQLSVRTTDATDSPEDKCDSNDGCTGGTADVQRTLSGSWLKAKASIVLLQDLSGESKLDKAASKNEGLARDMDELLDYIEDRSPEHAVCSPISAARPEAPGEQELTGLSWAKAFGGAQREADEAWAAETAKELQSEPLWLQTVVEGADESPAPRWEDEGSEPQRDAPSGKTGASAGGTGNKDVRRGGRAHAGKLHSSCCVPRRKQLSKPSRARAEELFQRLLTRGTGKVRREDALQLFQTCFGEDADDILQLTTAGSMTQPEFVDLCNRVKMAGYTDGEILDQLEENFRSHEDS